jgi:hypothetical protein
MDNLSGVYGVLFRRVVYRVLWCHAFPLHIPAFFVSVFRDTFTAGVDASPEAPRDRGSSAPAPIELVGAENTSSGYGEPTWSRLAGACRPA